jgi:hypothetical protein
VGAARQRRRGRRVSTAFSLDLSASVAATFASFAAASEAAIASRAWSAARSDVEAVGTRGWGGAFGMVAYVRARC